MSFEPGPVNPQPASFGIHTVPSFDVIARLPPAAADRLRALRQNFKDRNLLIPKHDQVSEASAAKQSAEARLKRLVDHAQDGGFGLKPSDVRVLEQQRSVDKASDGFKRLLELQEVRSQAWQTASRVVTAVETWLRDGIPSGVALEDIEGKPPELNKGESIVDAIERLRRRGRELKADLARISAAPYPSAHVRKKIQQEVEALALIGRPVVSDVIEHDRSVVWPMQRMQASVHSHEAPTFAATEIVDCLALFAFVHRKTLLEALDALVTEEQDDAAALSHVDRETKAAVVMGDLLAVEYDEARLVWQAQAEKLPCEFRADLAPQCTLLVRLVNRTPRNGSGSSEEHAGYNLIGAARRR